ncbi:HD domain-containing protein [Luteolibacter marinus]|uniref:HD domain-containing protein n=1 Tax=Luteolibacter marinus TaxID=2776705 RepID=UPI0018663EEE|nr:hypothetical protein [Luteolibacter marinus]
MTQGVRSDQLRDRFVGWCHRQGSDFGAAGIVWQQLEARYGEPHRAYHNLRHIASSLDELDGSGRPDEALEGAIWFHDVIYDPKRADNEVESIRWFRKATGPWLNLDLALWIAGLIEATDFRLQIKGVPGWQRMVDIDLAILSAEQERYDEYARAIREEYAYVDEPSFREGRGKVLEHFLSRPIYRTSGFQKREGRARANLVRELQQLRG